MTDALPPQPDFQDADGTWWHTEPDGSVHYFDASRGTWVMHLPPAPPEVPARPPAPPAPPEIPVRTAGSPAPRSRGSALLPWAVSAALALALIVVLAAGGSKSSPAKTAADSVTTAAPTTAAVHATTTVAPTTAPPTTTAAKPTTTKPAPATTAAPKAAVQPSPTTTTAAASPAAADVSITQCVVDSSDNTLADVGGSITNHDTQTDDYEITVTLLEGSLRVGEADDAEDAIAAGQTSTWSTNGGISGGNGQPLTCQVAQVDRSPSN